MQVRNRHGARLRCDHAFGSHPDIAEAIVIHVRLADGSPAPFGSAPTLVLDVFDLHSGIGGRDRFSAFLEVLTAHQQEIRAATFLSIAQAFQLCCPMRVATNDGDEHFVFHPPDLEPSEPQSSGSTPRPLAELLVTDADAPAERWLARGRAALAAFRPDLALESFEAAIERDSRCGAAHLERALLLWLVDRETVLYDLERCIDAGFLLGAAFSYKGLLLNDLERTEEATTAYRKATEVAPDFPAGWYLRGLTAVKQGRYEESIAATSRTLELAPRHASSYYTRACAHALSGQPELALDDIRRALECDPALCTELRADADFVSLRADSRFIALVDPWPSDAELLIDHELVRALRASGWRLDPSDIEIRTPSSLAQRVAGGLLIVGQQRDEVYVNFRPRGQGEEGEWWLYTKPGEHGRAVGELIASWQNELTHRNFREFVVSVKKVVHSKVEWHRGHP